MRTLIKCSKRTARRQFDAGGTIYMLPHKVGTNSMWIQAAQIDNPNKDKDFNQVVAEYTYYNCNHEVGYYPYFYL